MIYLIKLNFSDIEIIPYIPENVGCASIDLTLSNEFRYYKPGLNAIPITEETDFKKITEKVRFKLLKLPFYMCIHIYIYKYINFTLK